MKSSRSCTDLTDFIVPRLAGSARAREVISKKRWRSLARFDQRSVEQLGSDEAQLKQYTAEVDKLLEREQSRKQSVEGRLTSIIGLTSIAATIVLSGLVSLAAGTPPAPSGPTTLIFAIGSLYLVLQLFVALFAAVNGLSRAVHLEDTAADLFEAQKSAPGFRLRREIARKLGQVRDYRRNGDAKVDQMAVAHRAVKNFLVALLLLAFAAAWVAVTRDPASVSKTGDRAPAASTSSAAERPLRVASDVPPTHTPAEPVAGGVVVPLLMTAGGLALLVAGAIFVGAGKPVRNIGLGAALLAGGSTLSLLGGSKFELQLGKFDKLIGELQIHLFEQTPSPPPLRAALMRVATIGPFPDGDHVLQREVLLRCLRDRLTPDFTSMVGGWQIVGRVDKRQLKSDRALLYGSNQALAMTRANWVRDQVLAQIPGFDAEGSIVSVGGAGQVGAKVGEPELQSDRTVDIYVLVAQPVGKGGKIAQKPPKPLNCSS
jgi:hypothetical protein